MMGLIVSIIENTSICASVGSLEKEDKGDALFFYLRFTPTKRTNKLIKSKKKPTLALG
jgi:hypothetical protein